MTRAIKWLLRGILAAALVYVAFAGAVLAAMVQPPARFGQIMRHVPEPLVWGALPATRMWLWARRGALVEGELAPDFTLPTADHSGNVTLSSHRGTRPVVLIFGSYT